MWWGVLIGAIWADQLTKLAAESQWWEGEVSYNSGISWSWGSQLPAGVVTAAAVGLALFLGVKFRGWWVRQPLAASLFWGGAISNLIDRVLWGRVADWWQWPWLKVSNNLADLAILGSLILMILTTFKETLISRRGND